MTEQDIIKQISSRLGIEKLNAMQLEMMGCASDSIQLIAPTGSGKTLAFAASMLRSLKNPCGKVQGVVIAPSRELVLQIYNVIRPIATGYKTVAFYGGHAMREEQNSLSVVPDIIIATPGRLLDHVRRKHIGLADVEVLVLDEYDKSLELGFEDEMKSLVKEMKNVKRMILTSATRPEALPTWLPLKREPLLIEAAVAEDSKGKLQKVEVRSAIPDKLPILVDLIRSLEDGKVMVFVNHRESAERVWQALVKEGIPAGLYHGALDQSERELAIDLLNNSTTPVLVTTDLGARGLDIVEANHVVHYHLPPTVESWTHRNGRTARMGNSGTVYVITSENDSLPDYVVTEREYVPTGKSSNPVRAHSDTLYFNLGKKEKVSRGDIAGFILSNTDLPADRLGKIVVKDHGSIAAVPAGLAPEIIRKLSVLRLKGKKVKVSQLSR